MEVNKMKRNHFAILMAALMVVTCLFLAAPAVNAEDYAWNFWPEDGTGYTSATAEGIVTITYNGAGNTYKPVTAPGIGALDRKSVV